MNEALVRRGKILLESACRCGLRVGVAESCTGGLLSAYLTEESGASVGFGFGVVAYRIEDKVRLLGVEEELVQRHGVVSEEVAGAMLEGIFRIGGEGMLGISVTGVAGPGGVAGAPIGRVYIGVGTKGRERIVKGSFEGERNIVRTRCVEVALEEAQRVIETRYS